jgi:hypothetical protein
VWVDSGLVDDPTISASVGFYDGASCGGSLLGTEEIPGLTGDTAGVRIFYDGFESGDTSAWSGSVGATGAKKQLAGWEHLAGSVQASSGAVSAMVHYVIEAGASTNFRAKMDDVQFFQPFLFKDGFETGNTSRWSGTVP